MIKLWDWIKTERQNLKSTLQNIIHTWRRTRELASLKARLTRSCDANKKDRESFSSEALKAFASSSLSNHEAQA